RRTQSRPRSSRPTASSPSSCGSPPLLPFLPYDTPSVSIPHPRCRHSLSRSLALRAGPDLQEEEEIQGSRRWLGRCEVMASRFVWAVKTTVAALVVAHMSAIASDVTHRGSNRRRSTILPA
uniref:Uncharacterized protein n=1 Tax=Aegilops tauschii subsp. strangulata TaxID=200361 RepID=A0A452Y1W4_AEGTS